MASKPTPDFVPIRFAVLTVSDSRGLEEDRSGATLVERIEKAGHVVAARAIVSDDVSRIRTAVRRYADDPGVDAVITTGGTGLTGRDVTPEAVEPLFDKRIDGFAIVFHMVSHAKIGTSTIQSRATAGLIGTTFVFCLPGSPGACRDAWDHILAEQFDSPPRPLQFRRDHAAPRRASATGEAQAEATPLALARWFASAENIWPDEGAEKESRLYDSVRAGPSGSGAHRSRPAHWKRW